jgi:hypothetical protein
VTGDDLVAAMADVGVDQALLITPWALYRSDSSYIAEVFSAHPGHFGLVAPIDPYEADAADAVTAWGSTPGAVGIRLMAGVTKGFRSDHDEVRGVVLAAVANGLPVCVFCPQQLSTMDQLARLSRRPVRLGSPRTDTAVAPAAASGSVRRTRSRGRPRALSERRGQGHGSVYSVPSPVPLRRFSGSLSVECSSRSESNVVYGELTGHAL